MTSESSYWDCSFKVLNISIVRNTQLTIKYEGGDSRAKPLNGVNTGARNIVYVLGLHLCLLHLFYSDQSLF